MFFSDFEKKNAKKLKKGRPTYTISEAINDSGLQYAITESQYH